MAKRKAATASRKAAATRAGAGRRRASAAQKKTAARKSTSKAARPSAAKRTARTTAKSSGRAKPAGRAAPARKAAKTVKAQTRQASPKASARKPATKSVKAAKAAKPASRPRSAPAPKATKAAVPVRKSPSLNRTRRIVPDDDEQIVQSPPSSLDLDRTASAARSGRRSLLDRFESHNETSPALTAGDVDADWESAYSVGDEAPGGDNPTPDQDIVDDIGKAVGIEYQDNEELKGAAKVEKRDRNRWELDPASSEDWEDR